MFNFTIGDQTINNEIDRGTVKQAKRINGKLI